MTTPRSLRPGARLVVKVGSSSLAVPGRGIDAEALVEVVDQVAAAWESGNPTVLVSSGAVAAGLTALGLERRPTDIPSLQVAAAVGQGRLMEHYSRAFAAHDLVAGQVLLTRDVLANREQYLHAREALQTMLASKVVPIVNENDTVVVDELKLGDNDRLAAIVSHLADAAMLVILTDTQGLFSGDPRFQDDAELLSAVRHTDEILDQLASGGSGPLGSGGVATKVAAARMAAWSGIPTVIAQAGSAGVIRSVVRGEPVGTWVEPHDSGLSARKLWIAFGLPAVGRLRVDRGAAAALIEGGRSLLAVGINESQGTYPAGAAVEVEGPDGSVIAKGLVTLDSAQVSRIRGLQTSEIDLSGWGGEVIHRDDLVVLVGG